MFLSLFVENLPFHVHTLYTQVNQFQQKPVSLIWLIVWQNVNCLSYWYFLSTKTEFSNCKLNSKARPLVPSWMALPFRLSAFQKDICLYCTIYVKYMVYIFPCYSNMHVWYVCPLCYWLIEIKTICFRRYQRISLEFSQNFFSGPI